MFDERNMSPDVLARWELLTDLEKRAVEHIESGFAPQTAYVLAGGTAKTQQSIAVCTSQLFRRANVAAFRRALGQKTLNDMIMTRAEMQVRLTNIARADAAKVTRVKKRLVGFHSETGEELYRDFVEIVPTEELAPEEQTALASIEQKQHGIKLTMHSPLAAMKQLAEVAGYNETADIDQDSLLPAAGKLTATDAAEAATEYQKMMG